MEFAHLLAALSLSQWGLIFANRMKSMSVRGLALMALSVILIADMLFFMLPPDEHSPLHFFLYGVSSLVPLSTWIYFRGIFNDQFRPSAWLGGLAFVLMSVETVAYGVRKILDSKVVESAGVDPHLFLFNVNVLPVILVAGFSIIALLESLLYRSDDLCSDRHDMTVFLGGVILIGGVILTLYKSTETGLLPSRDIPTVEIKFGWYLLVGLLINLAPKRHRVFWLHDFRPGFVDQADTPSIVLVRYQKLMDQEKPYLKPGFSLDALVKTLNVPKHLLRDLLFKTYGYGSFTALIEERRIQEAKNLIPSLAPEELSARVVAARVGFSSPASFKKAFKRAEGLSFLTYITQTRL